MTQKKLQRDSEYDKYDMDGDGVVTDDELEHAKAFACSSSSSVTTPSPSMSYLSYSLSRCNFFCVMLPPLP